MTLEDMLAACAWFTRWMPPGTNRVRYACRAHDADPSQQHVGDTPREALERMMAARERQSPNQDLF